MINDISAELEKEFGVPGTPEREQFEEETYAFHTGQLLLDARKEAKVTQTELARRINSTKSYISRVENGEIIPSAAFIISTSYLWPSRLPNRNRHREVTGNISLSLDSVRLYMFRIHRECRVLGEWLSVKFETMVYAAVARDLISTSKAASLLHVSVTTVRKHLNVI